MSTKDQGQIHVVRVASSVIANTLATAANTATIAGAVMGNIFVNPTESATVNLYVGSDVSDTPAAPRKRLGELTPFYMWLTGGIFLLAILCLFAEMYLGSAWQEPTAAQANIIGAVDYGWKMGLGFAVGLVTGKGVPDIPKVPN
jgi:hypothetical protein